MTNRLIVSAASDNWLSMLPTACVISGDFPGRCGKRLHSVYANYVPCVPLCGTEEPQFGRRAAE